MKILRVCTTLLALLMFAPLCFAQSGMEAKGTKNSSAAVSGDEAKIIAAEQQIMGAIKNRKPENFKALVDPNGSVMSPQGAVKVLDIMNEIFNPATTITEYRMEDAKVMMVNNNAAMLTYKSISTATMNGKTESETSYDSTLWVKRNGKWMAMFHQSTPIKAPSMNTEAK